MASRRLQVALSREGVSVGRRRVRRLMKKLGLWAVRPKRNTSKRHPEHKVYPYLLRGKTIDQPNQVWVADVTYIPMQQGFLYLVAIIDWATRRVLSWRLSNTLTAGFCVEALSEALARFGKPGIQTSEEAAGQVYVPQINWLLVAAVLGLVIGFRSSAALANAD